MSLDAEQNVLFWSWTIGTELGALLRTGIKTGIGSFA